jgi:outer membrane protein OmpA-like peptidoglycan-associated protein
VSVDIHWEERVPLAVPLAAVALGAVLMVEAARLRAQDVTAGAAAIVEAERPALRAEVPTTASVVASPVPAVEPRALQRLVCPPLPRVHFSPSSATLAPTDAEAVARLGAWLVGHPEISVAIDGYADRAGAASSNLLLSDRRAQAVAQALSGAGVPASRMVLRALGARSARDEGSDASSERRAELSLLEADCVDAGDEP